MSDFDRDLERELRYLLDPVLATPIPAQRTIARSGLMVKLLGGAGGAVAAKLVTGLAIAVMAAGAAGAATEVAITHSLNPAAWGQQMREQIRVLHSQVLTVNDEHPASPSPENHSTANGQPAAQPAATSEPASQPSNNPQPLTAAPGAPAAAATPSSKPSSPPGCVPTNETECGH